MAVGTGAVTLAQTVAGSTTDLQMHKFQAQGDPERAADSASISDRTAGANGISHFAANPDGGAAAGEVFPHAGPTKDRLKHPLYRAYAAGAGGRPRSSFSLHGGGSGRKQPYRGRHGRERDRLTFEQPLRRGSKILYSNVDLHSIRATIPPEKIEEIAALPDVIFISPQQESRHSGRNMAPGGASERDLHLAPGFASRAANVRRMLGTLRLRRLQEHRSRGKAKWEPRETLPIKPWTRAAHSASMAPGLKIGVLSDGVTSRALSQATKDLPPTCGTSPCLTVLPAQAGAGDEGTAMLEIIHDMVPGADLFFATADNSITSFAANIRALQAAGCNVIVDDVFYFVETPFQDGQTAAVVSTSQGGVVTQAVNDVVAQGVFYFTAAGDEGGLDAGTSGTFEGDFVPQAAASPLPTGNVHNFGGGHGFDTITSPGEQVVGLFWADPLGGSNNDYDLYLLNSTGASILGASTNIQNGTQDPVELIGSANVINNNRLVVFQNTGALNRFYSPGSFSRPSGCSYFRGDAWSLRGFGCLHRGGHARGCLRGGAHPQRPIPGPIRFL